MNESLLQKIINRSRFRTSVEHIYTGFSKLISTWTELHFEFKWNLTEKTNFFYHFRTLVEKFSEFGPKTFDVIFKNTFYESRETLSGYLLLLKNWHFLVTFTAWKKFRTSGKKFLAWLLELHSTCPLRHFEEKNAIWRTFTVFYLFQDNGRPFPSRWQTFPIWLSKILSVCRLVHFGEN